MRLIVIVLSSDKINDHERDKLSNTQDKLLNSTFTSPQIDDLYNEINNFKAQRQISFGNFDLSNMLQEVDGST